MTPRTKFNLISGRVNIVIYKEPAFAIGVFITRHRSGLLAWCQTVRN